jgi:hypothetical protein
MNYKDVALLNSSLDSLGDSLLKNKMLNQQKEEAAARTGLESQRLGVDQEFRKAQQQHYNTMESRQADANTTAEQRQVAQEAQGYLHTIISANAAGMLDDDQLSQVNEAMANDPNLGKTGIQLSKPRQISPQAGQNATAQALQQAEYWEDKWAKASTDEDKARFRENADIMRAIAQKAAAPPTVPQPKRTIKLTTGSKPGTIGAPDDAAQVTQEFTPEEYQAFQAQKAKGKPLDAQTAAAILQSVGGDKAKARALAIKKGYSLTPAQ